METCDDVIGDFGGNHPLSITKRVYAGSLIYQDNTIRKWESMPSGMYDYAPGKPTGLPSLSSLTTRALAASGPMTPKVNLPLFIFELKDIPMMLRHAGNLLLKIRRPSGLSPDKEAAAATLAYQFGWAPLIGDLWKLLHFSDSVNRRVKELNGAHSSRGLRRKVNLGSSTWSTAGANTLWSTYGLVYYEIPYTATLGHKDWAVVRWIVRDKSKIGKKFSHSAAFRSALGLNLGQIPITIWKALPWTWLIDWFTGISDTLQANYNMITYRPSRLCVMRTSFNNRSYEQKVTDAKNYLTSGTVHSTFKERFVVASPSSSPYLRLPFLDNFKLSILGSLTILKIRGR